MKNSILLILISSLLFGSCVMQRTGRLKNEDQISMFTISRTPCFGSCPIYTLRIDKNCVATLDAIDHLSNGLKGWHKTNLPEKEWMKLVSKLNEINYNGLQDSYGNRNITDLPSVNTSITFADGNMKKINDYGARGTDELTDLYAYVDALIGKLDWQPTDAPE